MTIARIGLLLLRRFIAPVAVSALALTAIILLPIGIGEAVRARPLYNHNAEIAGQIVLFFMLFTGPAILAVGLPLGYAVTWLRAGRLVSLLVLVAIGILMGILIIGAIFAVPFDELAARQFGLLLFGGLPGGITALIWGLFNLDLYQRPGAGQRR